MKSKKETPDFVLYMPASCLGELHWEVWNKLPDFHFQEAAASRGAKALRAKGQGFYIWVDPAVVIKMEVNPNLPFLALGTRLGEEGQAINFHVPPIYSGDLVTHAKELNHKLLAPARRRH